MIKYIRDRGWSKKRNQGVKKGVTLNDIISHTIHTSITTEIFNHTPQEGMSKIALRTCVDWFQFSG